MSDRRSASLPPSALYSRSRWSRRRRSGDHGGRRLSRFRLDHRSPGGQSDDAERRRRKCLNCAALYRPDPRNLRHQRYCSELACRRASKAASQRRWWAKGSNCDYLRGPEHVERVRAWPATHPGCPLQDWFQVHACRYSPITVCSFCISSSFLLLSPPDVPQSPLRPLTSPTHRTPWLTLRNASANAP